MSGMRLFAWSLLAFFAAVLPVSASPGRDQLLQLVPADAGFCLILEDFRGQAEKWQKSPWIKTLHDSTLGQAFVNSPEIQHLQRLKGELKSRLDVDWPTLRDDIFGDLVIFAYRPKLPANPDHEQGLFLLQARKAELLAQVLARLDEEQKKSGELKDLTVLEHRGAKFKRRTDRKNSLYVLVDGNLLAVSSRESLIRWVIDQKQASAQPRSAIAQQLSQAGADQALLSLWINPRAFEPELEQQAQKDASQKNMILQSFLAYWRPLQAVVLSLTCGENYELKMSLQARVKELPPGVRKVFQPSKTSEVWSRFPANAVLTVGDRVELPTMVESLADFSPPEQRKLARDSLQKTIGAALGLDLVKDVLPSLGPDWGLCVAAAEEGKFPHILAALAVKPGGDPAVDQALFKGLQFCASLLMFEYNRNHANPIRMKSVQQDKVDVKCLINDKDFPAGLQPAFALKAGYLLLASSPEAISMFQAEAGQTAKEGEAMLLRLSTTQLAKLLRQRRQFILETVVEKNQIPRAVANYGLDTVLGVLDLVDQVTMSQSAGPDQASWSLRLRPRVP